MTSVIDANSTGIVQTGSSTAALNIQTGGTTAISVSTGQVVTITNPTVFPAGSASAPAVTTTGDTNTGVYFPAADQVAVTTGGTVAAAFNSNGLFFRNRIINGSMSVAQRGNVNVTASGGNTYVANDRFTLTNFWGSGQINTSQSTTVYPSGYTNSLGLTVSTVIPFSGSTGYTCALWQSIEGFNIADAYSSTITLSFWVRSSVTGTYSVTFTNLNSTSIGVGTRIYVANYTISAANTWEQKTITVPLSTGTASGTWDTTNGTGLCVAWNLGAESNRKGDGALNSWQTLPVSGAYPLQSASQTNWGSNSGATFYLTGVQLETGSVATPFERRPYGTELMLCQRYYYRLTPGVVSGLFGAGYVVTTTQAVGQTNFPVPMRVRPTALEQSGTANQYEISHANTTTTCSSVPTYQGATTANSANTFFTVSSGLTVGQGCALRADATNGATAFLAWSAEL